MENSLTNTKNSSTHSLRHRKSIFANDKPKPDDQDPKLLLNGETLTQWYTNKPATSPNFYQSSTNNVQQHHSNKQIHQQGRRMTGSFYLPNNPINKVIITNSNKTSCVRPSSLGRRSVIINQPQIFQRPAPVLTQSRVLATQPQILMNSKIIPSQTSNIPPNMFSSQGPSVLKRKSVLVEGKPHDNVIFRHSPIKQRQIQTITEIRPEVSRILIQDDPKTINQLNKLASLNQFLNQQYSLVNNELIYIRNKTSQKQVVDDKTFLQKSLNRIDDIFLRETNQALFKLDEISRCSSSKGFSKSTNSRLKKNHSPTFNKIAQYNNGPSGVFTPIKGIQHMQNSSYIQCNHLDPMAIYDEI